MTWLTVLSSCRSCWFRVDDSCRRASRAAILSSLIWRDLFKDNSNSDSSILNLLNWMRIFDHNCASAVTGWKLQNVSSKINTVILWFAFASPQSTLYWAWTVCKHLPSDASWFACCVLSWFKTPSSRSLASLSSSLSFCWALSFSFTSSLNGQYSWIMQVGTSNKQKSLNLII